MIDWNEIIKNLNTNHIYKVKRYSDGSGLEIWSDGLNSERRKEIISEVVGKGFDIVFFPNEDFIKVTPKK